MKVKESKNTVRKVQALSALLLMSFCVCAQDTLELPAVNITGNRLQNFSTGSKIQQIDSATLVRYSAANLADVLSNESALFIKSYGLGSMATSSFRGAGANQTIILWNGFNLNSVMNGMLDLALIPVGFSSKVSIQHGGAGALWGSGAMGGAIHIEQQSVFNRGFSTGVNFSAGSFQNLAQQIFAEYSEKNWVTSLTFFNSSATNDFEFHNTFLVGNPLQRQINAERKSNGLLFENAFNIKKNQHLRMVFWYQITDRNIPPTMLQGVVRDNQKDENYRAAVEYQYEKGNKHFFVRSAYFDERFNYNSARSRSQTNISEAELKWKLNRNLLNIGLNNSYAQAAAASYAGVVHQNRTAFFTSFKCNSKQQRMVATATIRQEIVNADFVPFTYSIGIEFKIKPWCLLKMTASKLYRVPTLNDLYWNPGGNLSLKPEEGYSEDASLKLFWKAKNEKTQVVFEPGVFNRNTTNQITWLPSNGFWTPQNMVYVWSRGVETISKLNIQYSKLKIQLSLLTNCVLATSEQSKTDGDASVGKQLIYTPRYSGSAKLSAEYKGFYLAYSHSYVGYRYTATDNSQFLLPYDVANIYLSKNFKIMNVSASAFCSIENIFNKQYQVVLSRAMPMRYYTFGLSLNFNYKNKTS